MQYCVYTISQKNFPIIILKLYKIFQIFIFAKYLEQARSKQFPSRFSEFIFPYSSLFIALHVQSLFGKALKFARYTENGLWMGFSQYQFSIMIGYAHRFWKLVFL